MLYDGATTAARARRRSASRTVDRRRADLERAGDALGGRRGGGRPRRSSRRGTGDVRAWYYADLGRRQRRPVERLVPHARPTAARRGRRRCKISDATGGAAYKTAAGFVELYGDYGEIGDHAAPARRSRSGARARATTAPAASGSTASRRRPGRDEGHAAGDAGDHRSDREPEGGCDPRPEQVSEPHAAGPRPLAGLPLEVVVERVAPASRPADRDQAGPTPRATSDRRSAANLARWSASVNGSVADAGAARSPGSSIRIPRGHETSTRRPPRVSDIRTEAPCAVSPTSAQVSPRPPRGSTCAPCRGPAGSCRAPRPGRNPSVAELVDQPRRGRRRHRRPLDRPALRRGGPRRRAADPLPLPAEEDRENRPEGREGKRQHEDGHPRQDADERHGREGDDDDVSEDHLDGSHGTAAA